MSYYIKSSSWKVRTFKEEFFEVSAICEHPAILGSENFDINRVIN